MAALRPISIRRTGQAILTTRGPRTPKLPSRKSNPINTTMTPVALWQGQPHFGALSLGIAPSFSLSFDGVAIEPSMRTEVKADGNPPACLETLIGIKEACYAGERHEKGKANVREDQEEVERPLRKAS